MSADPNKKSARTFQCRDVLWETFEQMARELECSVDYLVNEAMKQYARQRSYGASRTPYPASSGRSVDASAAPRAMAAARAASVADASVAEARGRPAAAAGRLPPPPAPARQAVGAAPARAAPFPCRPPPRLEQPASAMPPLPRSAAAPSAAVDAQRPASAAARELLAGPTVARAEHQRAAGPWRTLTLVYNGERHSVTKDRFVIGRGKQSSDLTLKDPNVSRQHAMIEFQNGVYFMVDMGSTNGVEYNGQRIARKQIAEGDVFRICDHDLQFTYR